MLVAAVLCAALGFVPSAGAATRTDAATLVFDDIPAAAPELTAKLDEYLAAREATPLGWSPSGQLLIATRFGDIDQLHVVEMPAGARRQLTFGRDPVSCGAISPDPARRALLFMKNAGGGADAQLYYQRLGEAGARLLTDGKSANGRAIWSNAGSEIAFFSTARDGVTMDVDIVNPESGALPRLVVSGGDGAAWYPLDWSPDDRKLLVLKHVTDAEAYLYVVELDTGQKHEVDAAPSKTDIVDARFSRDGQGVYLISDRDGEFAQLRFVNLFTAEKNLISGHVPWSVEELALSRNGRYLAYVTNEAGTSKLNLLDLKTHQELTPPRLPGAGLISHLSFDAGGNRLAFGFATPKSPRDAFVLDLASNALEPWTHSEPGPLDAAKFVLPRLTEFPTFDRLGARPRPIPAYVYEPQTPGPRPVLILLQGGPQAQFRPGFDPWIQFVVDELGFAVVAPNVRGSGGYGKTYRALANGSLREDAVKDLGALLVWLGGQSAFDAKHVVVSGTSYGGYLALAALFNYGDRLRGGVAMAAITDLVRYVGRPAPPFQGDRRAEFGDERDPDMRAYLKRLSPLTNALRINRPLLIVHGRNDSWVPIADAQQLVNQLRAQGDEVWYLQANDEGHEFRRKADRDAYLQTFAQFLAATR